MLTSEPWRHMVDLDGLSLARGVVHTQAGASVRESLAGGDVKIVFLLDGTLQWGAGGTPLLKAGAGSVNVCFGAAPLDIDNVYRESGALRYFSLRLSERYLQAACGLDAHALTRRWREAARESGDVSGDWCGSSAVLTRAMSAEERHWTSAMTSQVPDGDDACWQRLALVGQTFEALARCAAYTPTGPTGPTRHTTQTKLTTPIAPHAPRASQSIRTPNTFFALDAPNVPHTALRTPAHDVATGAYAVMHETHRERITRRAVLAARDVLEERLQTPPSLPVLAREVGINVNKLCAGFRAQFGTTVHGYVRERRLATAFELLSARRISVSEAAWQCGYTDSHFAKVFRARFGMLPNTLTRESVVRKG